MSHDELCLADMSFQCTTQHTTQTLYLHIDKASAALDWWKICASWWQATCCKLTFFVAEDARTDSSGEGLSLVLSLDLLN